MASWNGDFSSPVTGDAVVVVPGIMGTELIERDSGALLWGARSLVASTARLGYRSRFRKLMVTEEERAGHTGRIVPTCLLRKPAWAPGVGGFEPYAKLVETAITSVMHPDAVLKFGYDWRLSVEHNAGLLAEAAARHLERWQAHPERIAAGRQFQDEHRPRLVFVAHSMGGLVVQAMLAAPGRGLDVRSVTTVGTPFRGSVKAVELLATGRGAPLPLPEAATAELARSLPGVYDLLPDYRCRIVGADVIGLTARDVVAVGGDPGLATDAYAHRRAVADVALPDHIAIVGTTQPTAQSLEITDGVLTTHRFGHQRHSDDDELQRNRDGRPRRVDHSGDGTVFRYAARPDGVREVPFAQQHAALVRHGSALEAIGAFLTGVEDLGTALGRGDVGLDVPGFVRVGTPLPIHVTGETDPVRVTCAVEDTGHYDTVVRKPQLSRADGGLRCDVLLEEPGLFRVRVGAGGDPVTKLVMAGAER